MSRPRSIAGMTPTPPLSARRPPMRRRARNPVSPKPLLPAYTLKARGATVLLSPMNCVLQAPHTRARAAIRTLSPNLRVPPTAHDKPATATLAMTPTVGLPSPLTGGVRAITHLTPRRCVPAPATTHQERDYVRQEAA